MTIENREKGDFILDLRINQVGKERREKIAYMGDKKLAFRIKIPSNKVQILYESLKTTCNETLSNTKKLEISKDKDKSKKRKKPKDKKRGKWRHKNPFGDWLGW